MSKNVQLTIPKACHEDWDKMTAGEQGRYCMSCEKTVIDFTNMSDRAILHHIANVGGSRICGRLHSDQLHRSMTIQKESRLPWLKYFFQFMLPAFLISMKAKGQEQRKTQDTVVVMKDSVVVIGNCFGKPPGASKVSPIKGRVLDERAEPVAGASVMIKGTSTGTNADAQGYFSLEWAKEQDVVLWVSGVGFVPQEIQVKAKERSEMKLLQLSLNYVVMGEVNIVRRKKIKRSAIEIARSVILPDSVKLSPNPVGAGNDINIELNVKQTGKFNIEVSDISGRMISRKSVMAEATCFKTQINTEAMVPGNYIVTVRNKKGKAIGVKKIILQH